jgi:pimeloyl-ACP methyl ester carboxylesterase
VSGQLLDAGGVQLCAETFGDPADPALLLIAGAAGSMDGWDPAFCRRLADGGRYVIRYDHRDTGRSVTGPPGAPDYSAADLTEDPVRLLDALGLGRVHLAGVSMGGGIAQDVAARHPDRVATLTLIATTAAGTRAHDTPLPSMDPALAQGPPEPDWSDRDAVVEYLVEAQRPYAGSLGLDEPAARRAAERTVDRSHDVAAAANHWQLAGDADAEPFPMAALRLPTLVLHGADDPLFPLPHGEALAAEIAGARLVVLPGMGHEAPPEPLWDVVVPAILGHTGNPLPLQDAPGAGADDRENPATAARRHP